MNQKAKIRTLLNIEPYFYYILFSVDHVEKLNDLFKSEPNIKLDGISYRYNDSRGPVMALRVSSFYELNDLKIKGIREGGTSRKNLLRTKPYRTDQFGPIESFENFTGKKLFGRIGSQT